MTHVEVTKIINHTSQSTWRVLADFQSIHKCHSAIESVDQLSKTDRGIGAVRRCNFYGSRTAVEQIINWEEGRFLSLDIIGGTLPFKKAQATFSVIPTSADNAKVTFEMNFEAKSGLIGKLMKKTVLRRTMKNVFKKMIAGLETHIRTGKIIGKDGNEIAA